LSFWPTVLAFAQTVTTQVGSQLLTEFGQVQASQKEDGSLVTQSDQWADRQLREAIATAFPNHGVLSEEGLLYQGTPVFGYVHLPPLAQSFHGFWSVSSQPDGAFVNQVPIAASTTSLDSNCFFSLCSRSTLLLQQSFPCKIRMLGAASYNFLTVAAGATLGGVEATPKIMLAACNQEH